MSRYMIFKCNNGTNHSEDWYADEWDADDESDAEEQVGRNLESPQSPQTSAQNHENVSALFHMLCFLFKSDLSILNFELFLY